MEKWAMMSMGLSQQYLDKTNEGYDSSSVSRLSDDSPVRIDMQNVADYFWEQNPQELWHAEDIPVCRPPWPRCWITFRRPPTSNNEGTIVKVPRDLRTGYACSYTDVSDDVDIGCKTLGVKKPGLVGGMGRLSVFFFATPDTPSSKTIAMATIPVWYRHDGTAMGRDTIGNAAKIGTVIKHLDEPAARDLIGFSTVARDVMLMGFAFCHCKNVEKEDVEFVEPSHIHPRSKRPKRRYYVLKIQQKHAASSGAGGGTGTQKALHICRGHFATYSAERPLFGKYEGTFWVPMHTRGKRSLGEVVKAYDVRAKDPSHPGGGG